MELKHFGDSYDIVKRSLLQWLSDFGPWAVHPMFSHFVTNAEADSYSRFLGVPLVSSQIVDARRDRPTYLLSGCEGYRSLFLDPDTGLRLGALHGKRSAKYLFSDELLELVAAKVQGLVMVFDQSLPRGGELEGVKRKLAHFLARGAIGFAYVSHASFIVLGRSDVVIGQGHARLLEKSRLPGGRIVAGTGPSVSVACELGG